MIQWALRAHRDSSQFFPSIAEIRVLVNRRRSELREAAEAEQERVLRAELAQARANGKLLDFADVKQKIMEIAAAKQMEPPVKSTPKPFTTLEFTEDRREALRHQAEELKAKA